MQGRKSRTKRIFFVCTLIECIFPEYRKTINGASKQKKIVNLKTLQKSGKPPVLGRPIVG